MTLKDIGFMLKLGFLNSYKNNEIEKNKINRLLWILDKGLSTLGRKTKIRRLRVTVVEILLTMNL